MNSKRGAILVLLLAGVMSAILLAAVPTSQAIHALPDSPDASMKSPRFQNAGTLTHGIASGDVKDTSVLLWTRASQTGTLTVEVSLEPDLIPPVLSATVPVSSATDFTARYTAQSLQPSSTYYYRWWASPLISQTGEFKTAPAPQTAEDLRFAFSGDSDGTRVLGVPFYNNFEVLDAIRANDPDFFVYLGDIVYSDSQLRPSPATTLPEYRDTYKENRLIQALPDLLASTSTYAIWDDHEVMNDFDGQTVDPLRYAFGRQALLEYMPITDNNLPSDSSCAGDPLFRVFSWGTEVDLIVLDERSCRSADVESACMLPVINVPDPVPTLPPDIRLQFEIPFLPPDPPQGCLEAINDPSRTFLGPVQKQLFKDTLINSTARWKIVVSELPIQQFFLLPYDRWEGYAAERVEILNFIRANHIENVIFVSTDIHANLVNQVYVDFFSDPEYIADEFVTGPIATGTLEEAILAIPIPGVLEAVHDLFDLIGMECRELDAYSYGLVDIDAGSGLATISLRDDSGNILVDSANPEISCLRTLGYDLFLPQLNNP